MDTIFEGSGSPENKSSTLDNPSTDETETSTNTASGDLSLQSSSAIPILRSRPEKKTTAPPGLFYQGMPSTPILEPSDPPSTPKITPDKWGPICIGDWKDQSRFPLRAYEFNRRNRVNRNERTVAMRKIEFQNILDGVNNEEVLASNKQERLEIIKKVDYINKAKEEGNRS